MNRRVEEFPNGHDARYRMVTHPGAFNAQEQAAAETSGWSWAKVVAVRTDHAPRRRKPRGGRDRGEGP